MYIVMCVCNTPTKFAWLAQCFCSVFFLLGAYCSFFFLVFFHVGRRRRRHRKQSPSEQSALWVPLQHIYIREHMWTTYAEERQPKNRQFPKTRNAETQTQPKNSIKMPKPTPKNHARTQQKPPPPPESPEAPPISALLERSRSNQLRDDRAPIAALCPLTS